MTLPNQLTMLRIILTPLFIITYLMHDIWMNYLSFIIFFIASITDYYDGVLARRYGVATIWGRFLDPLADKILISSAFIVFMISGVIELWMVLLIVIRDVLITTLRSYAMYKGKPIVTSYLAKVKTFFQIGVLYFIFVIVLIKKSLLLNNQNFIIIEKIDSWNIIYLAMLFVTLLTLVTGVKYIIENRTHIKSLALDFYHVFVPSDL